MKNLYSNIVWGIYSVSENRELSCAKFRYKLSISLSDNKFVNMSRRQKLEITLEIEFALCSSLVFTEKIETQIPRGECKDRVAPITPHTSLHVSCWKCKYKISFYFIDFQSGRCRLQEIVERSRWVTVALGAFGGRLDTLRAKKWHSSSDRLV